MNHMHIVTTLVPFNSPTAVVNICLTLSTMCSAVYNCSFVFTFPVTQCRLSARNVVFLLATVPNYFAHSFFSLGFKIHHSIPFNSLPVCSCCDFWLRMEKELRGKCILDWRARFSVSLTITEGVDQALCS